MKYQKELEQIYEEVCEVLSEGCLIMADKLKMRKVLRSQMDFEQMSKEIDIGIENGYSLEAQLRLMRMTVKMLF